MAPASTSNSTGYPGDLKFPGRCGDIYSNQSQDVELSNMFTSFFLTREEVPRLTVTWTRELERRQKPGRWSPGGWRSCGERAKF